MLSRLSRASSLFSPLAVRSMATVSAQLSEGAAAFPHKEAVRFDRQNNMKWTLYEIKRYSDALSAGMLEVGMKPGDVMLSWLPDDDAEHIVLQLACARGGFTMAKLDPAVTDTKVIGKVLKDSKARAVFHKDVSDTVSYLDLMKEVVPEMAFHQHLVTKKYKKVVLQAKGGKVASAEVEETLTKTENNVNQFPAPGLLADYPNLEFPVHTGFDQERGFLNFKHMLLFNADNAVMYPGTVHDGKPVAFGKDETSKPIPADSVLVKGDRGYSHNGGADIAFSTGATPDSLYTPKEKDALYFAYDAEGNKGAVLDHKGVVGNKDWEVVSKILKREYVEPQN